MTLQCDMAPWACDTARTSAFKPIRMQYYGHVIKTNNLASCPPELPSCRPLNVLNVCKGIINTRPTSKGELGGLSTLVSGSVSALCGTTGPALLALITHLVFHSRLVLYMFSWWIIECHILSFYYYNVLVVSMYPLQSWLGVDPPV